MLLSLLIGGILGTSLRYAFVVLLPYDGLGFPWATFAVNMIGSFVLGYWSGWLSVRPFPDWLKVGVGTGLCGSFTTMSTFAAELSYWQGEMLLLATYLLSSIGLGVGLAGAGWFISTRMLGANKLEVRDS